MDCPERDFKDELNCTCLSNQTACDCFKTNNPSCPREDGCIDNSKKNDGNFDCNDKSDEPYLISFVEKSCESCTFKIFRFTSIEGCENMAEEICDNSTCKAVPNINCTKTFCKEPKNFICFSKCLSSIQPYPLPANCTNFFICKNREITMASSFCNGKPDCSDSSDEIQNQFGFKCQGSKEFSCVLPQDNLHDGDTRQCSNNANVLLDEKPIEKANRFKCLDNSSEISIDQVCDNILDCPDLSDECLCPINLNNLLCKTRFQNSNVTVPGHYSCGAVNTECSEFQSIHIKEAACDGNNVANDIASSNTIRCQAKYKMVYATRCDGIPECSNFEDECSGCSREPEFCKDKCHSFYPMGDRYCNGFEDFSHRYLGKAECDKGFDEKEKICKNRFRCKAGQQVNIPLLSVNDQIVDCDNGDDEDGKHSLSSSKKMIKDDIISVFVWIIAIVTLCGNGYVIYSTSHLLRKKKMHDFLRVNHILILNLSIADFIMGIYLLIVSIKNLQFMGKYGEVDLKWKTGFTCSLCGVLAIISSETSCFIMSILSTFRLVNIMRPLKSLSYPAKPWFILLGLTWLSSFLLAVLPLVDFFEDFFVYQLYFDVPFTQNKSVTKSDILTMACRHASIFNHSFIKNGSWEFAMPYLKDKFNTTVEKIHYYGETSLCMPRFYVHKDEDASEFPIFIISLNFVSFVYVCLSYLLIFKVTSNRPVSNKQVDIQNAKLQKRIVRLLATDFICWIPICIIAFVKYLYNISLPTFVYTVTITFLLPVNSALNPLLYTPFFDKLFEKIQTCSSKPG